MKGNVILACFASKQQHTEKKGNRRSIYDDYCNHIVKRTDFGQDNLDMKMFIWSHDQSKVKVTAQHTFLDRHGCAISCSLCST